MLWLRRFLLLLILVYLVACYDFVMLVIWFVCVCFGLVVAI